MEITSFVRQTNNVQDAVVLDTIEREDMRHDNLMNATERVINRTKKKISPFARIEKKASFTDSRNLTGYGVELDTGEGMKLMGTVSPNYLLIPNKDVMSLAEEILFASPYEHELRRVFFDGGRFAAIFDLKDLRCELDGRGDIGCSLLIRNSYNGSWPLQASLMAIDYFCENGMITGKHFGGVRFKHLGEGTSWKDVVSQGLDVLESADVDLRTLVDGLDVLRNTPLRSTNGLKQLVQNTAVAKLGPTGYGKVLKRFMSKEEQTGFGLLSACTHTYWHGSSFSASDFKVNKDLVDSLLTYASNHKN